MTIKSFNFRLLWLSLAVLLLAAGCQSKSADSTPDYPVTAIPPAATTRSTPTLFVLPTDPAAPAGSPTVDWGQVTLLPLRTPEAEQDDATTESPPSQNPDTIPDPFTDAHLDLLAPGQAPFELGETEISLGRLVLPVDLLQFDDPFSMQSHPIENYPGWNFLAFDLPLPAAGELGALVRAPFDGEVLAGSMQMLNDETVSTVSVDHILSEDQLIRATFVYSGPVELLFVMGQPVKAGEVLFRLTRDTGRVNTLGSTPIPKGATLTLHASVDTVIEQESGVQSLRFLRGVSLTPSGLLRDEDGLIISPSN